MKNQANKHCTDGEFMVGDWVFLKLRSHVQQSMEVRVNLKFAPRYYDLYQISECVCDMAYRLKLPDTTRIHLVFHYSLLKKAISNYRV